MSPFDKLFQAQVDKLLSANNKRRAFFFRGFLPKQIEFLIRHKTSLYMNEDFIEDDCLQIQKIEANKRALVKQLALAEDSVVGFYEELVAISSAVNTFLSPPEPLVSTLMVQPISFAFFSRLSAAM